jgi:CMP-N,N'-diacetyllegionaminic acid synthase
MNANAHGPVLAVIPARGGSKGLPGKNIREVGGRPLLAWTIEAARSCACIDRVILSSDDPQIIDAARRHGCDVPFVRDPVLASDTAPTIAVVLDALERCPGHEWVVLLQPTSPLRTAADIDAAFALCLELCAPACVSVSPARESPYWMYELDDEHRLRPLLDAGGASRRQDLPVVHSLNGAIYIARVDWLHRQQSFVTPETVAYTMPVERALDIDTEHDLFEFKSRLEK